MSRSHLKSRLLLFAQWHALRLQRPPTYTHITSMRECSSSASGTGHWMDSSSGLQAWLDRQNRHWWITALMRDQTKKHPQLQGHQVLIKISVESEFQRLLEEHSALVVDSRASTHLQSAALALATHKVLLPFLRDEELVLDIIGQHMGSKINPLLKVLMRFTAMLGLPSDTYGALVKRLEGLQLDYGQGFDTQLSSTPTSSTLTINSCFYKKLFEAEGAPQLTTVTCCSQDKVWIEAVPLKGVNAELQSSQAAGDDLCCFYVYKENRKRA